MRRILSALCVVVLMAGSVIAANTAPPATIPGWSAVATSCRATPPLAAEQNALPDGATTLVGTITGLTKSGAIGLVYPGSNNQNYNAWYPYVCVIAGNFDGLGAPQAGDWIGIESTSQSTYSEYVLHAGVAIPYTDPVNQFGGGPSGIGFYSPYQLCNYNNVPAAARQVIDSRSCFTQAFSETVLKSYGKCAFYPDAPGQPTLVIFDGFWNSSGQYCPNVYGGSIAATVCADGRVLIGVQPC